LASKNIILIIEGYSSFLIYRLQFFLNAAINEFNNLPLEIAKNLVALSMGDLE
jgi:hypothetical protein